MFTLGGTTGRALSSGGGLAWRRALASACAAFIGLVAVGSVLVAAAKLQFTSLGAGSDPLRVLSSAVMAGLTTLGTGVRIGTIDAGVVPLGALLATGAILAWAAAGGRTTPEGGEGPARPQEALLVAARFGSVLALICLAAAFVFRIPEEPVPVSVSPLAAGALALVWGTAFGALGILRRGRSLRDLVGRFRSKTNETGMLRAAMVSSTAAMASLFVMAFAATLLGIIYRLATSPLPGRLDVGDVIAGLVYLAAFLPNVLVAVAVLGTGASITAGAEITAAGERVGPITHYSLSSWGNGDTPMVAFLLLLVPLVSFAIGGFYARASASRRDRFPVELVLGAAVSALVLGGLCLVADARLGGGLVSGNGVAKIAPDAAAVVPFVFGWALGAGLGGWLFHDLLEGRNR